MAVCKTADMASDNRLEYVQSMQTLPTTDKLKVSILLKQSRNRQPTCISAADWASTILNNALRQALINPCQALLSICQILLSPLFHGYHSCSLTPQNQSLSGPGCPLLKDVTPQLAGTEPPHLGLQFALAQLLNCIVNGLPYIQ